MGDNGKVLMKRLNIIHSVYLDMIGHGQSNTDQEMCGMLLGTKQTENTWEADKFEPIENVHVETNYKHYRFHPTQFMNVLNTTTHAGGDGKDFVGIFHTHPNNKPTPSTFDIDGAGYNVFYIIYSPKYHTLSTHFCIETEKPWKEAELIAYEK